MPPTSFFTTDDGDVVLRVGTEPGSKHDFRVHKVILSLASPVFKDTFTFPQPPGQTLYEQHQLPVVEVLDPPEVMDTILRLIYPGVEPPKITELPTLSALFLIADKYNITSIYPTLREILKTFLPGRYLPDYDLPGHYIAGHPLWVYIIACRFGFSEEAKEAAKATRPDSFVSSDDHVDLCHISSTDLFRLIQFVQERERNGRRKIKMLLDPMDMEQDTSCGHGGEDAQDYYLRLEREVENAFVADPCVGPKDLFEVLDRVPDPPPGCKPRPKPAEWYYGDGDEDAFDCPLRPMTIRRRLVEIAENLYRDNDVMLRKFFGKGVGSV